MKAFFLHLSDLHVVNGDSRISNWIESIPKAIFKHVRKAEAFFIVLSGDLAFSGKKEEFELVGDFLGAIKQKVKDEFSGEVHIVMSPGNHDCDFSKRDGVREVVVDNIVKEGAVNDSSLVKACTSVQKNYRDFSDNWQSKECIEFSDDLVECYRFLVGGKELVFVNVNVSWMSRLNEKQGEMVFPAGNYKHVFKEIDADVKFCIMHHPLNWYSQASYHEFRVLLQGSFNGIFSGHEHVNTARRVSDLGRGDCVYFEAPSLGPEDGLESAFSAIEVDLDSGCFSITSYELDGCEVKAGGVKHGELGEKRGEDLAFDSAFKSFLLDPGGSFKHSEKDSINSDDIFVYPEVKIGSDDSELFSSVSKVDYSGRAKVIYLGDDKSGKTFLLKRLALDFHDAGLYPIFINASNIKSVSDVELEKEINRCAVNCYGSSDLFGQLDKAKRVVLVDDIDRLPGSAKNKLKILTWLDKSFEKIVVTASINMQFGEFVNEELAAAFSEYDDFRIQDFGYKLRHDLIKKWCQLGDIETKKELDQRVHSLEGLINAVIGKNLVPARPIYLLILIQSNESQQHRELESASLAYYYQFLITRGLTESGWPKEELNEIFNYLSCLAWHFKSTKSKELTEAQLKLFNDDFSKTYTRVDFKERVALLIDAKILGFSHGCFSFLYPYVYYFFIGKYLSVKIHGDAEVRDVVVEMCKKLYRRENANSVLFLSHHAGDTWLAEQVLKVLSDCFSDNKAIEFNGDTAELNKLVECSAHVYLQSVDVEQNQLKKREQDDKKNRVSDSDDDADEAGGSDELKVLDFSVRMNLLFKTTEILGQIVKTYYGSIQRVDKKEYLKGVLNGPLRMLGFLFEEILKEPDLFVKEIGRTISDNKKGLVARDLDQHAKKAAFDLVGMICTGTVARTAQFVDSDKVTDDLSEVVRDNPSNAFRLIQSGTGLLKPGGIDYPALRSLAQDLKDDIFPFKILQTLVVNHIHMFHTSDADKQRLSEIADITIGNVKKVDFKGRGSKTLKK
ncbi:metallophosphoesterase [Alcanivorax profundi]|uniref:STAND family AAA ATPase n=1 Tax=Alcanivorax profundi TaxID=2338368 RepID=UPI0032B2480D|tara:strand:+ start:1118 stop:4156 length:3039 start_codon:yes stop_codon:yes gene_type:complete